jgi:hypothetical protein
MQAGLFNAPRPHLGLRNRSTQPLLVERVNVGLVIVNDRIPRSDGFHLQLRAATRTVVFADHLSLRIGSQQLGIQLSHLLFVVAHIHEGIQLPILSVIAKLVPAVTLDHPRAIFFQNHVQVEAVRKQNLVVPRHSLLQNAHVSIKYVSVP